MDLCEANGPPRLFVDLCASSGLRNALLPRHGLALHELTRSIVEGVGGGGEAGEESYNCGGARLHKKRGRFNASTGGIEKKF